MLTLYVGSGLLNIQTQIEGSLNKCQHHQRREVIQTNDINRNRNFHSKHIHTYIYT